MKTRARSLASRASLRVLILGSAALVACEARTPPPSTPRAESPKISATTEEVSAPTSSPTESTTSRPETATPPVSSSATSTSAAPDPEAEPLVALAFELPKPAFKGTPKHAKSDHLEPPRQGPRDPFLAPKGTKQLAKGAAVTSSDDFPIVGELELVTDGDKEAHEGSYLELGPGTQYVQIDLGRTAEIRAILLWQFHMNARIYHDVVVRVSDDPDFFEVTTLYNNDHDNSSGFGVGDDYEYWETHEGHLVDGRATKARYVRVYSNGNTEDELNHFTEVEVWGR